MCGHLFLDKGSSSLKFTNGTINSLKYCKILEFAKKQMEYLEVEYLQEDNARIHSTKASCEKRTQLGIKIVLKSNVRKVTYFCPGKQSRNEPYWSSLRNSYSLLSKSPTNLQGAKKAFRKIWKNRKKNGTHKKYCNSFGERI